MRTSRASSIQTQAEASLAVFDFIEGWYNPHRRHSAIGYLSPINFERRLKARRHSVKQTPLHGTDPTSSLMRAPSREPQVTSFLTSPRRSFGKHSVSNVLLASQKIARPFHGAASTPSMERIELTLRWHVAVRRLLGRACPTGALAAMAPLAAGRLRAFRSQGSIRPPRKRLRARDRRGLYGGRQIAMTEGE